jgi:hypothetical protein
MCWRLPPACDWSDARTLMKPPSRRERMRFVDGRRRTSRAISGSLLAVVLGEPVHLVGLLEVGGADVAVGVGREQEVEDRERREQRRLAVALGDEDDELDEPGGEERRMTNLTHGSIVMSSPSGLVSRP